METNIERAKRYYDEMKAKGSDADALFYARLFAPAHGGRKGNHIFTDDEIRAGKCGCPNCDPKRVVDA